MNILWLAVNTSYAHSSLSLPLLHSAAVKAGRGDTWETVQTTTGDSIPDTLAQMTAATPDVILATCYLFNRAFVLSLVKRFKNIRPDCRVFLGGPEFWGDNAAFLWTTRAVDAVVRGEGEAVIANLLTATASGNAWGDIPGLCWLAPEGSYRDNGTALVPADDLAELPPPAEDGFVDSSKPFQQIETSRGCAGNCCFCTSPLLRGTRTFTRERVQRELDCFSRMDVREVRVVDRTFNQDAARCTELLKLFRNDYPNIRFHLEIHPAFLSARIREELSAFPPERLHVEAGIQTFHEAARRAVKRAGDIDKENDGLRFLCNAPNLPVHVDLIAGLPETTLSDVFADVKTAVDLAPDEIQLEILKTLPGTPLAERSAAYGIRAAPEPPYEVLQTDWMNCEQLQTAGRLSKMLEDYYNNEWLQSAFRHLTSCEPDFLHDFYNFLETDATALREPLSLKRRFVLLHTFIARYYAGNKQEEQWLETNWLRAGLSASHGLCPTRRWKGPLPGDAVCEDGNATVCDNKQARVWHIFQADGERWVVMLPGKNGKDNSAIYVKKS